MVVEGQQMYFVAAAFLFLSTTANTCPGKDAEDPVSPCSNQESSLHQLINGECYEGCPAQLSRRGTSCEPSCPVGYSRRIQESGVMATRWFTYEHYDGYMNMDTADASNPLVCPKRRSFTRRGATQQSCEASFGKGQCERYGYRFYPKCTPGFKGFGQRCIVTQSVPCENIGPFLETFHGGEGCKKVIVEGSTLDKTCPSGYELRDDSCFPLGHVIQQGPVHWDNQVALAQTANSGYTRSCGYFGCRVLRRSNREATFGHGLCLPRTFYLRPPADATTGTPPSRGSMSDQCIRWNDVVVIASTHEHHNQCGYYGCRVLQALDDSVVRFSHGSKLNARYEWRVLPPAGVNPSEECVQYGDAVRLYSVHTTGTSAMENRKMVLRFEDASTVFYLR